MGYSISWIAFNSVPPAEVLSIAGLTGTEAVEDIPAAPFQTASLPNGWTVLFSSDAMFAGPDNLKRLSRHHALLGCIVEEHVMVSMAAYYIRGEMIWEVVHDGSSAPSPLLVSGSPPPELAALRASSPRGVERDADSGFDLPVRLAEAITGYRHDRTRFQWGSVTFNVAVPIR